LNSKGHRPATRLRGPVGRAISRGGGSDRGAAGWPGGGERKGHRYPVL